MCVATSATQAAAQNLPPPPNAPPRGIDELQQLVSPVALYPDALLAQVLTASTYPEDVIAAARWEDTGNNPATVDSQPWDSSVKGVARYPDILHYLASNAEWMNDLGDAFLNQQPDVMSAVQNLRGEALAAGTLTNTPQQTVLNQDGYIQIIPTDPQYVYAPIYDPRVVYAPPPVVVGQPYPVYVTFGPRVEVGDWLDFDFDWHDRAVYSGRWGRDRPWWHDWRQPGVYHYLDLRPGIYAPGRFRDDRGRPIVVQSNHWTRDDHRPPPRRVVRADGRPPMPRPERGYPGKVPAQANRPSQQPRGSDVSRQSERGRVSRGQVPAAAPRPSPAPAARPAPQPPAQREPPPRQTPAPAPAPQRQQPSAPRAAPEPARAPARQAPARPSTPAPAARPSAPTRGGAMGGYQSGQAASQNAARGAASRGRH